MLDTAEKTEEKDPKSRVQLRITPLVWEEMKIQAVREHVTAEQLAEKAFKRLLDMPA